MLVRYSQVSGSLRCSTFTLFIYVIRQANKLRRGIHGGVVGRAIVRFAAREVGVRTACAYHTVMVLLRFPHNWCLANFACCGGDTWQKASYIAQLPADLAPAGI